MARLCFTEVGLLLLLALALMLSAEARERRPKALRRRKREWIHPPAKLMENFDYTLREYIAKIRSDKEKDAKVLYYLSGPGANKPPYNLFVVDPHTGFVRITAVLDREKHPFFNLTGIAKFSDGTTAEEDIPLAIAVLDMNDNGPWFEMHSGSISEASKEGTFVMQIVGKDNDQAGTINSEIAYSIISQEPEGSGHMFTIDEKTGNLYVKEPTLDRETYDFYKLVVKGTDMGGAEGGLTGTGTVEIKVLDINDNIPTLEQSEYSGSVDENVADVVVMRIKALDKDLEHTDNWLTVYTIVHGNEDNLFSIETDKETNEGILKLIKPVDFEEIQNLELGLSIENVAPFVEGGPLVMDVGVAVGNGDPLSAGGGAVPGAGGGVITEAGVGVGVGLDADLEGGVDGGLDVGLEGGVDGGLGVGLEGGVDGGLGVGLEGGVDGGLDVGLKPDGGLGVSVGPAKGYPIKIAVNNVPEGPAFVPEIKEIPVSENPDGVPEDGVIAEFTAVDPDTGKPAEDVSYAKAYDPDNWFTIDEETAEIKLNKAPDRESAFVVNGTYIAKILAITKDMPSQTATGTLAIQVADFNDHCPTLTTSHTSLCSDLKTVYVTGFDEDAVPNAAPFTFRIIPDGTRGSWDIEVINETTAAFHSHVALWPGTYALQVEVLDAQGLSCPADEIFTVDVCTCVETGNCGPRTARQGTTSSELAAPAIGLLLLAMCLLLLIPLLLLFCQCGGAGAIFPDQFSDLPFDAKEHLISYHTEGRGEDKEVPLQSVPVKLIETAPVTNFNSSPSKLTQHYQTTTSYEESMQEFKETSQSWMAVDNTYRFSEESHNQGFGSAPTSSRQMLGAQRTTDLYEGIALPDAFLDDYYSQKVQCVVPVKDGLLGYDFEGQDSPVGSVGCCSLLESENDLQFLNDLGPKFKILAQICSPPTPAPKPSLTHKTTGGVKTHTVDVIEQVVEPKIEHIVETKRTDIEKVTSSTDISKSSVSTVSTDLPSMTLPRPRVTNFTSTNISHSATLPRQAQTIMLQQQPVYYTTSPVLQPMHYVVQPQLQNTVLLANGAHGANFPGLYVVSGPRSPPSGFVVSGPPGSPSGLVIQGPKSPTSPVSPTLLLPGGPGMSAGSVPEEGWKILGPNTDGTYMLVKDTSSPGPAEGVDPGSSQGTLPRDAILVKEAAPPQGVLGPAAKGSVYGILPGHTVAKKGGVVTVNSNLGQTWVGQPGQMAVRPATVLGDGQPRLGMGQEVTVRPGVSQPGIWPAGMNPVGTRQVNVNQFQEIPQSMDASGILKAHRVDSPKEDKTISIDNTIITAENANQPSREEVKYDSDPAENMDDNAVEEKQDVISDTSEHDTTLGDEEPGKVVQSAYEDNEGIQEYPTETSEKSSIVDLEEDTVKSLPDVTDLVDTDNEEASAFPQGEGASSALDNTDIDSTEENVGRLEAAPLKEEEEEEGRTVQPSIVEGPEDRSAEVGSEPQSNEVTEDLQEDVGPVEKVVPDLETNPIIATSDSIQLSATPPNEISTDTVNASEEMSIPDQEAIPEPQVDLSEGNKIDEGHAMTDIADSDAKASLSAVLTDQGEGDLGDLNLISESEEVQVEGSNAPTISTTMKDDSSGLKQEDDDDQQDVTSESGVDNDLVNADADSISDEEKESVVEEGGLQISSTSDDQEEDTERQYALSSQMEDNLISDDNITDEDAVEEIVSEVQQSISEDEESAREDASRTSSREDDTFISDDNMNAPEEEDEEPLEEVAVSIQQNVSITDYQDEEIEEEAVSERSSPLEDQLIADDNIGEEEEDIVEEVTSAILPHLSISNDQDEDVAGVDAGSVIYQLEDQLDSTRDGSEEEDIVEEEVSPVNEMTFISNDDEDGEKEGSFQTVSQAEDELGSDDISDEEKEEKEAPSMQQNISDDQDEESEREDATGTSSHVELESTLTAGRTECLSEEVYLASQNAEMSQVEATSKVTESQERPCEDQVMQGFESSQTGDVTLDVPERPDTVGEALVGGTNMEGLDDVVTSSEGLRSSRVATGQVSMSSEDKGASGRILASGQEAEGETTQFYYQNTDVIQIEQSEGVELKEGAAIDLEIREGLDNSASGQVSTSYSEIEVVHKTVSPVLEAETGTQNVFAMSEVAEEAVQNESVHMTGEAAGVTPTTVGEADTVDADVRGDEASGGEVSPAQLQTVSSPTRRNKSRKSKKDSSKSPKSPSGKCKQQ